MCKCTYFLGRYETYTSSESDDDRHEATAPLLSQPAATGNTTQVTNPTQAEQGRIVQETDPAQGTTTIQEVNANGHSELVPPGEH